MTVAALSSGSEDTAPRKTAENTARHCGGGERSVVVTTLIIVIVITCFIKLT